MTFEEAIIKKLQEDYKLLQMSCDGFKSDRDRLAAELAEAQRQVEKLKANHIADIGILEVKNATLASALEFWKETAERRGDEIKRMYTEASHKEVTK